MAVDSYLELFTTLFGWQFYGIVWDVLATTGIVYIPFIVMLVSNWKSAASTSDYRSAWSISLRNTEIDFYLALFVAILTGPPTLTLSAASMSFTPSPTLASPTPATATIASPHSTYGGPGAFNSASAPTPGGVQVPIWWYTVMVLSKGINHAILTGFPTERGLRMIEQQAQFATISDPRVREEAVRFWNDCFLAARSRYLREKPNTPTVSALLSTYGNDDTEWMGSHVLRTLYYPEMRARRPVTGWLYDPARDVDYDPAGIHTWGQPTCEEWWSDPTIGLREKIASMPTTADLENVLINLASALPSATGVPALSAASEKAKDWAVRAALDNARVDAMTAYYPDDLGATDSKGVMDAVYNTLTDVIGGLGMLVVHVGGTATTNILKMGLPMVQAVLLMVIYAILPFVVVFSRYSLGVMLGVSIALFSIHFWTVLWRLAAWVDENLLQSMFPGTLDHLLYVYSAPGTLVESSTKMLFLDLLLMAMLVGMPIVWSIVMGWAGVQVTSSLGNITGAVSPKGVERAGEKGVSTATTVTRVPGKKG